MYIIYTHDLEDYSDKVQDYRDRVTTTKQFLQHSLEIRRQINERINDHSNMSCEKKIRSGTGEIRSSPENKGWDDCAFFFTSWDSLIIKAPAFREVKQGLNILFNVDAQYRELVQRDIESAGKAPVENPQNARQMGPNEMALAEKTAVAKLILDRSVELDSHFSSPESWHLFANPGPPPASLVYALKELEIQGLNTKDFTNFRKYVEVILDRTFPSLSGAKTSLNESFTGGFYDSTADTLYAYGQREK